MEHIVQLRVEHQSSPKLCNRGVAGSADASLVTLALAAIASLALFLSSFSVTSSQNSSTLPARLLAAASIFTSKTALFVLSNVVIVLLAADYRCRFATAASACHAASSTSGEPAGGVLEKQAQHHQVQVQVDHCAVLSSVPCLETVGDHNEQEGEDRSTMSAKTLPDEEQVSKLELIRLGEEEDSSSGTLEETDGDVEEPACETGQGLDGLEISELNRKFDEFIRSRRIKWVKEEACLLLCEV